MPSADAGEELNAVHQLAQEKTNQISKQQRFIVMDDFNAKVGVGIEHPCCSRFGLGEKNERGQKMLDWLRTTL